MILLKNKFLVIKELNLKKELNYSVKMLNLIFQFVLVAGIYFQRVCLLILMIFAVEKFKLVNFWAFFIRTGV